MTRHGECNHCGHCCQMMSREAVVRTDMQVGRDQDYYKARGFHPMQIDGLGRRHVLFAWMHAPCPQHVESRCAIDADKPKTCRDYPTKPMDIVGTPCSYWFQDGDGTRLGGLGSPYPTTAPDLLRLEAHDTGNYDY